MDGSLCGPLPSKIRSRASPSARIVSTGSSNSNNAAAGRSRVISTAPQHKQRPKSCVSPTGSRRNWGSTSSLEDISTSIMHVQRNQGSSNLGQIYDNEYAIQGQGSVSDSEISLTLIEDDTSFIDHEQSLNSLR